MGRIVSERHYYVYLHESLISRFKTFLYLSPNSAVVPTNDPGSMAGEGIKKLYYAIGEVSDRTGLEAHVLRYWETEFEQLKPRKNRAGRRIYTVEDIAVVERIQHLLRVEKYTIDGARQVLGRSDGIHRLASDQRRELLSLRGFLESLLKRI